MAIKRLSKATRIWEEVRNGDKKYIITSAQDRSVYTIYETVDEGYNKLGSGKNPFDLEDKYVWHKKE